MKKEKIENFEIERNSAYFEFNKKISENIQKSSRYKPQFKKLPRYKNIEEEK